MSLRSLVGRFISSVTYFFGSCGKRGHLTQELLKVLASELPLERFGDRLVVALEFQQSFGHRGKVREIVRGEDLALNNGEIDLDLIEPTGMEGSVNQH